MSTLLTPSKLRAWVKYHATAGAYCPAGCGKTFRDDEVWAWVLAGTRVYLICRECALDWQAGQHVVPPMGVKNLLESRRWLHFGHGLDLAPGQDSITTYEDPLLKEALELYVRLRAGCDGCACDSPMIRIVEIRSELLSWILPICLRCAPGDTRPFGEGARKMMVTPELAGIVRPGVDCVIDY